MDQSLAYTNSKPTMYPPPSILMGSDSSSLAHEFEQSLEKQGCAVFQMRIPFVDLAIAYQKYFDLVVLTIENPATDYFDLCNKLRTEPPLTALPIILLSSQSCYRDETHWLAKDSIYWLPPDADQRTLLQIIHQTYYITRRYL